MKISGIGLNTELYAGTEAASAKVTDSFSEVLDEKLQAAKQTNLDSLFEAASEKYGVSVTLLKAVAKAESNFNPQATSWCGAMGIMQLMPGTAASLGVTDAYDPEQNIMGGAKLLRQLLDQFDGDVSLALAGYNAGPGNVLKYGGIPPFSETQNYVTKVLGYCGQTISAGTVTVAASQETSADAVLAAAQTLSQSAESGDTDSLLSAMSDNLDSSIRMWAYMVQNPDIGDITEEESDEITSRVR